MDESACFSGAKDTNNFLTAESYSSFPLPSSLSHEGTLFSHFFSVPPTKTEILKCFITTATAVDPISHELDYFLCLGTSSKFDGGGLRKLGGRPPVKLVFVLDVSGSMGGKFHSRNEKSMRKGEKIDETKQEGTLLDAAKEALVGLLENMKEGDSFGLVTFCTRAETEITLQTWEGEKTRENVKEKIKEIKLRGATDLTCGFNRAVQEFEKEDEKDLQIIRRIFFLTDMRMTAGNSKNLLSRMNQVATTTSKPIHTTIIGFGFELDTNLCSSLSSVPLCNFFSVHSASEFLHQMTWEFDYLVFPIAENLVVSVVSGEEGKEEGKEGEEEEGEVVVEKVCGSPESLDGYPKGTIMGCKGIFASQTQGKNQDETKGGVVLVKLKLKNPHQPLKLKTKFVTHENQIVEIENEVVFPKWEEPKKEKEEGEKNQEKWGKFGGEAVRKGVLLCRYVEFLKQFLEDIQNESETPTITKESGVIWKKEKGGEEGVDQGEGRKVRKGTDVGCLEGYKEFVAEFLKYFNSEAECLDDTGLGIWRTKLEQLIEK